MTETPTPTLEEMLRRIKRSGYRLNNLANRLDGMWQANLRRAGPASMFFAWGYGVDAVHALERAMDKAHEGKIVTGQHVDFDTLDPRVTANVRDAGGPIPPGELPDTVNVEETSADKVEETTDAHATETLEDDDLIG